MFRSTFSFLFTLFLVGSLCAQNNAGQSKSPQPSAPTPSASTDSASRLPVNRDRKRESDQIAADQARIRENMKALKGSSEEKALLQRYVGQLDSQESRLAALRKETADLTAQENQANTELDHMIMAVNVDESF